MTPYESLLAERYSEPIWFAKPVPPSEHVLAGRRRLADCVAEFEAWHPDWNSPPTDAVLDEAGEWVEDGHGIKLWTPDPRRATA